jgi:hypothetical protein
MSWFQWIPALSTTGLLTVALWLLRKLISTRLAASVAYEFNQKIEAIRAELKAKENEISALRSGALNAITSRQIAIDQRRLEAVDQLWAAAMEIAEAKGISSLMAIIKYENSVKEAERNPKFRAIFDTLGGGFDLNNLNLSGASKARPFVSPMAWAYFSAYQAIAMQAVAKFHVLRLGVGVADVVDTKLVKKLVIAALPHRERYIEEYGDAAYHYLLEELENLLLSELGVGIGWSESDRDNVQRAAEIVRLSKETQQNAARSEMQRRNS